MNELVKVDSLPSKYASTYGYLWGGVIGSVFTGVFQSLGNFGILSSKISFGATIILTFAAAVCWLLFYTRFALACKNLAHKESKLVNLFAWASFTATIIYIIGSFAAYNTGNMTILSTCGLITAVIGLFSFICFIKLGLILKNNYSGILGGIGHSIITSILLLAGLIVVSVAGMLILGNGGNNLGAIIFSVIVLGYGIWILLYTYTFVWEEMIELIEDGYFKYKG